MSIELYGLQTRCPKKGCTGCGSAMWGEARPSHVLDWYHSEVSSSTSHAPWHYFGQFTLGCDVCGGEWVFERSTRHISGTDIFTDASLAVKLYRTAASKGPQPPTWLNNLWQYTRRVDGSFTNPVKCASGQRVPVYTVDTRWPEDPNQVTASLRSMGDAFQGFYADLMVHAVEKGTDLGSTFRRTHIGTFGRMATGPRNKRRTEPMWTTFGMVCVAGGAYSVLFSRSCLVQLYAYAGEHRASVHMLESDAESMVQTRGQPQSTLDTFDTYARKNNVQTILYPR